MKEMPRREITESHLHCVQRHEIVCGIVSQPREPFLHEGSTFVGVKFAEISEHEPANEVVSCMRVWAIENPQDLARFETFVEGMIEVRDAARASLHYDEDAVVYCIGGCGQRLFALVKVRGICFGCLPAPTDGDDVDV